MCLIVGYCLGFFWEYFEIEDVFIGLFFLNLENFVFRNIFGFKGLNKGLYIDII